MILRVRMELSTLNSKLLGYVGLMSYRFCHMCVKAEPSALLSIEENLPGKILKIEDMADVYPMDGDQADVMILMPKNSDYLALIVRGIMKDHPEFKVTLEKIDKDATGDADNADNKYIRVQMPEVDKNRRKLLLDLVEAQYKVTCGSMDSIIAKTKVNVAKYTAMAGPKEEDEAKQQMEEIKKQYEEMRENLYNDKKKEIEDAYARYQEKHPAGDALKNNGNDGKTSMAEDSADEGSAPAAPKKPEMPKMPDAPKMPDMPKNPLGDIGQSIKFE